MSLASIKLVPIGSTVTFRSKNPNDVTVWQGVLESTGSYKSILPYMNPASYNEAVIQADPTVSTDPTTLTYFLITVSNNATVPTVQVFSDEWIANGTLNIVTLGNSVTIVVDDPLNDPQTILSILANAGYAATIATS